MTDAPDPWTLTVATLAGEPPPPPPELPGTVHRCHDAPMTDAELAGITSPSELALIAGISRQLAHQRIQKARAKLIDTDETALD